MLNSLQIKPEFLTLPVVAWSDSAAYQASLINIDALNVINYCAERGAKLSPDFMSTAKYDKHYQNVLQIVKEDGKEIPNISKRKAKTDILWVWCTLFHGKDW